MFHNPDHIPKDMGTAVEDTGGTQSIARAAALLRVLGAGEPGGLALSDAAAASGLPKPTVRRILLGLIEAGLAEQDGRSRRYHLGLEAYALGVSAGPRFGLHALAVDGLCRLAEASGDTAFLVARRGGYTLCLHREEGRFPIRSHVLKPGDRHPFGAGAASIAMLAAMPEAEAEGLLETCAPLLAARYPRVPVQTVRDLVAQARVRGYGLNPGLVFAGSWGIAVAVRDPSGRVTAALTVAAIEARMQAAEQSAIAAMLRKEARLLEQALARAAALPRGAGFRPGRADKPARPVTQKPERSLP
jgi:DNA-binding IclR family transcriptional regulator